MKTFFARHKILTAIFFICIFFMIKNSSIPYLFDPPSIITVIFDAPKTLFFSEVAKMIDVFASAYVTSLLFYYMVDYCPTIKEEKKAKEIISPKLVNLYLYISELLAMIEYSAKQENLLILDCPAAMDNLNIRDKIVFCKKRSFKDGAENGATPYSYNLLKDCNRYRTLILDTCNAISGIPSFSYCDPQVIHIISEIQLSELIRMLPKVDDVFLQLNLNISYFGLGNAYQHLFSINEELSRFVETRLGCSMTDISPEEIEKWQCQNAEQIKQHPEIANVLAALETQELR